MTLWGGRFSEPPAKVLWEYTVTQADRRLLADDVRGSLAHVAMLASVGLLTEDERRLLHDGLSQILADAADGTFEFVEGDEDVHSAVERRLAELVGPVAGRLHTGRSRNDQVALDLRLYLARAATERTRQLGDFALLLADLADRHAGTPVASYTHLQQAQVVSLGHHFLAHAWAAIRDRERFIDARRRIAVSPLGAGAGGGSSLAIDPARVSAELGLDATFANSLDAVAARDFVAEYVFCCAQAMVQLSRMAEELVLWSTIEFSWVTLADAFTTGSSALPHKKNPDIAELARARAAGTIGDLTAMLALQKGLPLSYNRDLQEDKPIVFRADDTLAATIDALGGLLATTEFHPPPPSAWTTALDLAEVLVGRGVAFREAHQAVGRLVSRLLAEGRKLNEANAADLTNAHPGFVVGDLALTDSTESLRQRRSPGGGSPESVAFQVARLRRELSRPEQDPSPPA